MVVVAVVRVVVRKNWVLGEAGGFYIDHGSKGRVEDNSKTLWPDNHRLELSSTDKKVSSGRVRFHMCIRYPSGVDE